MQQLTDLLSSTFSGAKGPAATLTVATPITVTDPTVVPTVSNSGNSSNAILNFSLPRAASVSLGTTTTVNPNSTPALTNTGTNGDSILNFSLPRASSVTIGAVTTGAANTSAEVTNTGTNGDVVLNFSIPQGIQGIQGADGASGQYILPMTIVTGTTVAAESNNHYVLTNVASTSVTLPASPASGDLVWITVSNNLETNVVLGNTKQIQGLLEDLTLNYQNISVLLRYVNSSVMWRIV